MDLGISAAITDGRDKAVVLRTHWEGGRKADECADPTPSCRLGFDYPDDENHIMTAPVDM